jgi:predicted transcriptional regulator
MTEDLYEEMVSNGEIAVSGAELKGEGEESPSAAISPPILLPRSITTTRVKTEANSATDLHCPFNCAEAFKKDYQVHLHLKLKHRNEPEDVLKKAYDAVDEEIELTKRSASIYHCALCDKQFSDNFYSHISTKHGMQWKEYKDKFGRCEVESANFECSICSRVVKHDRNTVHTHLKNVHGINWQIYMERMRKLKKGEEPDELPQIETTLCQVCNVSVKYLKEHLRNAHKITEQEYETLFESESQEQPSGSSASGLGFGSRISISRIPRQQQLQDPTLAEPEAETQFEDPPPKPPKSDIHDKTNKRCSSCNIAFDSRRSFIEHCTTVHSMKFKTKSGITISAPTLTNANYINRCIIKQELVDDGSQHHPVLVPPPPPLLKRGAAVGPPDMTAVAKKPKTILTNEGNLEVEAAYAHSGPHLGPQYTSSGVSKWNQCRYECCFCKKTTMSRSSMTSHINNSHGISIQDYKKANYPDIEVETNWFKCRLCPTRTKFVKDCVAPHLKMSHSMEIETYEEQFMLPEDWPAAAAHKLATKSSYVGPGQFRQKLQSQQDNSNDGSHPLTSREMAVIAVKEDKWNKCKFQCCLCDWVSIDSRQMRSHIAAQHSLAYDKVFT